MEAQNIDDHFKKIIENSEDYYYNHSERAKKHIWSEVQKEKHNVSPLLIYFRFAAAATIFLFFAFSLLFYHSSNKNKVLISHLYSQIDSLKKQSFHQQQSLVRTTDNLIPVKKGAQNSFQAIQTKQVAKIIYLRDTVYVQKVVYESPNEINTDSTDNNFPKNKVAVNKTIPVINQAAQMIVKTEYIFSNNSKTRKKEHGKLFKIKFREDAINQSEPLSITAKL